MTEASKQRTMREYWDEFYALPEAEQRRLKELQDGLPARKSKTMGQLLDERRDASNQEGDS